MGKTLTKPTGKRLTTKEFIERAYEVHGDTYGYNLFKYNGHTEKGLIICQIHGEFEQTPSNHKNGKGCPKCGRLKIISGRKSSFDECIQKFYKVHGNSFSYKNFKYINNNTKSLITCKLHGDFLQTPKNHKQGNGCPKCRKSKGELKISKALDTLNIDYIEQKKFNKCKYKRELLFDFYIPKHKMLIEYNGEQHYKPFKHFGGLKSLHITQIRDEIKKNFATKNNYKLLIIPYGDYNNIENIIKTHVTIFQDLHGKG